jgi:hypothetical protein
MAWHQLTEMSFMRTPGTSQHTHRRRGAGRCDTPFLDRHHGPGMAHGTVGAAVRVYSRQSHVKRRLNGIEPSGALDRTGSIDIDRDVPGDRDPARRGAAPAGASQW